MILLNVYQESNNLRGPTTKSWGGNGIIGATAAVSWPALDYTYEAIVVTKEMRHGKTEGSRQGDLEIDSRDIYVSRCTQQFNDFT